MMHTYIIYLIREWTPEDVLKGVCGPGRYQAMSVLVEAKDEAEAKKKIFDTTGKYNDFKIKSISDWDELREIQTNLNIDFILNSRYQL